MDYKRIFTMMLVTAMLSACVPAASNPNSSSAVPVPVNGTVQVATPAPTNAAATAAPPSGSPTVMDQTPAQRAAVQALSKDIGVPVDQIRLVSTQASQWENGCLGVVIPGVLCTKGPVDGFRILLEANGKQYEYRTNQDGTDVVAANHTLASLQIVVYTTSRTVELVKANLPSGLVLAPAITNFLPTGGSVDGTAYVTDFTNLPTIEAVDTSGVHALGFAHSPNYGLAVWPGNGDNSARLAWGTQPTNAGSSSSLMVASPDGSNLETILTEAAGSNPPHQLVAERWSADGKSLYFSKEPVGIGGYILFSGASSLYKIDLGTKQVTEIIPFNLQNPMPCLDAFSLDYRYVADHCTEKGITVRDLSSGQTTTIQPPEDILGYRLLGSAQFSPDGSRLAYALAQGDPNNEKGWVAVSDSLSGNSHLILISQPGEYYTVAGWLDAQTLLVETRPIRCDTGCHNTLSIVSADGSGMKQVAEGSFLALVDSKLPTPNTK